MHEGCQAQGLSEENLAVLAMNLRTRCFIDKYDQGIDVYDSMIG